MNHWIQTEIHMNHLRLSLGHQPSKFRHRNLSRKVSSIHLWLPQLKPTLTLNSRTGNAHPYTIEKM